MTRYRIPNVRPAEPRRGVAAVEFAIVAVFLTILTVGMIEVTRAVQVKHYLTDSVRIGCRRGALPGTTNTDINNDVSTCLKNYNLNPADATVTISVYDSTGTAKGNDISAAAQGDRIAVKVAMPISKISWVGPMVFTNKSIESETLMMMRQG
jgi:Flp pilus assembly protein TadG